MRPLEWEDLCFDRPNETTRSRFVVGTSFSCASIKRVNFWNEFCPSSPALKMIWCDWMEFRDEGNNWEASRDRVELLFVNHWVSGSQPSLDIHRANNSLLFSELPKSSSWLPKMQLWQMWPTQQHICKLTHTHTQTLMHTHTWSADKGVSPSETCRHRPSDIVSRHLETEAVFKLHYQCSLSN